MLSSSRRLGVLQLCARARVRGAIHRIKLIEKSKVTQVIKSRVSFRACALARSTIKSHLLIIPLTGTWHSPRHRPPSVLLGIPVCTCNGSFHSEVIRRGSRREIKSYKSRQISMERQATKVYYRVPLTSADYHRNYSPLTFPSAGLAECYNALGASRIDRSSPWNVT